MCFKNRMDKINYNIYSYHGMVPAIKKKKKHCYREQG